MRDEKVCPLEQKVSGCDFHFWPHVDSGTMERQEWMWRDTGGKKSGTAGADGVGWGRDVRGLRERDETSTRTGALTDGLTGRSHAGSVNGKALLWPNGSARREGTVTQISQVLFEMLVNLKAENFRKFWSLLKCSKHLSFCAQGEGRLAVISVADSAL